MAIVNCPTCNHLCEEDDLKVGSCPQCGMPLVENKKQSMDISTPTTPCPICGHPCDEQVQNVGSCPECGMPLSVNIRISNLTSVSNAVLKDKWVSERIEHYSQLISEMKSALKTFQRIAKSKSSPLREEARENVNKTEKFITIDMQMIAALELLCEFAFVKEMLETIMGRKCEELEIKAFRIYLLNTEEEYQAKSRTLILDLFSSEDAGVSKQEVRDSIIERFRNDGEAREYFKKQFEYSIDECYANTSVFFKSPVIPILLEEFWPKGPDNSSQFMSMLMWLENDKNHIISRMLVDYFRDGEQTVKFLIKKKDIFIELFDEWSKGKESESNSTNENCKNESQTEEVPQVYQKKPSVGRIVLN